MSTIASPWETANIVGPKNALILAPENFAKLARTAKRPLLVVGGNATKEGVGLPDLCDYAVKLARLLKAPIVVSPGVFSKFERNGMVTVFCMGIEDLVNRLKERNWKGLDGKGNYDLVFFVGGIYYFQSLMLAALKHFAPHIKTISIDRFYQPNANFSFINVPEGKWKDGLDAMLKQLEEKK
jgi:acetyl-CoA decarbonylase/synthase complex subunit epsilon